MHTLEFRELILFDHWNMACGDLGFKSNYG
jgi:hypothetical protein